MATINETRGKKKSKALRYTLIGVGVAGLLTAGYFAFNYVRSRNEEDEAMLPEIPAPKNNVPVPAPRVKPKAQVPAKNDNFPLVKGSKGPRVKALQDILIKQHGKSILPKFGADGDFGNEMVNALKKLNLPEQINESTFNLLTMGTAPNFKQLSGELFTKTTSGNFNDSLAALKKIRNVNDYKAVNESYKDKWFPRTPRSIVSGLLEFFPSDAQKAKLNAEFLRIGLEYNGTSWSLPKTLLSGFRLITTQPTKVWKDNKTAIEVPAMTVLGTEVKRVGNYCLFENGGRQFLVMTSKVQYL